MKRARRGVQRTSGGPGTSEASSRDTARYILPRAQPQVLLCIQHETTEDVDGQCWPPAFHDNWFLIDSRDGRSTWRRIFLAPAEATDGA
jgi:hypothetical protein